MLNAPGKKVGSEYVSKKSEIQYFLPVNMENEAQVGNLWYKHNTKICKYMNIMEQNVNCQNQCHMQYCNINVNTFWSQGAVRQVFWYCAYNIGYPFVLHFPY